MAALNNDEEEWFLDSGATSHIIGNMNLLSDFGPSVVSSINTAGNQILLVASKRSVKISDVTGKIKVVLDVLYVPGIHTNLFLVGKFTDLGYRIIFNTNSCYVLDRKQPGCKDFAIYLQAERDSKNKLYKVARKNYHLGLAVLPSSPPTPAPSPPPRLPTTKIYLWHRRIGHANYQALYHMTSRGFIIGTPEIPFIKHVCSSCATRKMYKDGTPKQRTTQTTKPLLLIHTNLCGPLPTSSRTGNKYILTFINDFTKKTWLCFLAQKSQTLEIFKQFRLLVETSDYRIESLRSNRGGEYLSTNFISFCKSHGIHRQLTAGYSLHQNVVAK
jgi:hypothetical protein